MNPSITTLSQPDFFVQQFFTGCLAEMAYYIESQNKAIVIDPLRDITPYLELAKQRNATIEYVFLTHFHADFVSGHLDLAAATKATIVFGPTAQPKFAAKIAADEERIQLGSIHLRVLHTPGHTPESSCFLLEDSSATPIAIFTGDTLFLGDVGRPDLAVSTNAVTQEDLAGWLFDSLQKKIAPLDGKVIVYPGHGAGSPCGKNISSGTSDTLENQRKTNYALAAGLSRPDFIANLTKGLADPPQYFFHDAGLNKNGCDLLSDVVAKAKVALKPQEILDLQKNGSVVLDCRASQDFLQAHIPNSLTVNLDMTYAIHVGTLVAPNTPFVIVAPVGREEESIIRLARVGYDNVHGYLEGGFESFRASGLQTASVDCITPSDFKLKVADTVHFSLDVRNPGEYEHDHLASSKNAPLGKLASILQQEGNGIPKDTEMYVYCKGGNRSAAACSILKQQGYHKVINVLQGIGKLEEAGVAIVRPSI